MRRLGWGRGDDDEGWLNIDIDMKVGWWWVQ